MPTILVTSPTGRRTHRRVPRRTGVALITVAALWVVAVSALAAEDRVLVEEGGDEVDRAALVAEVERVEAEGLLLSVAVLAGEPSGSAEAEADRLVDARGGAALVITPTEVGGVSDDAAHDASGAVDRALDQLAEDDDVVAATRAFSDHLLSGDPAIGIPGLDAADGAGSVEVPGIGRVSITLIIVVVVGFILLSSVLRFIGRLAGGGRRRGYHGGRRRRGGMLPGAAVGYGVGRARRNARSGAGGTAGGTSRGAGASRGSSSRGGASRSRSSGTRSRSSGSRGGRSRSSGRRR